MPVRVFTFAIDLYPLRASSVMEDRSGPAGVRLNRFIGEAGVASRRAADRMIEEGRVTLNGRPAVLGDRVLPGDEVRVDGEPVSKEEEDIVIAYYKPAGVTCTSSPDDPDNVIDRIGHHKRIYSIGRLDKDSEGLLLLTNNGRLADGIMRSRAGHEKEYIVRVDREVTPAFVAGMAAGVPILGDRVTRRCVVEKTGDREFRIVLTQGLNRQIRRMCGHFGYGVTRLIRVRVMNITLEGLRPGGCRDIAAAERAELQRLLGEGPGHGGPGR